MNTKHTPGDEPLKVVAVVSVNNSEALVFNRPLNLKYERVGNDFIGSDGPIRDLLAYSRGSAHAVAFAGREIVLQMKDGGTQKIKDHWWSGILKGTAPVVASDVESLRRCYVFRGGMCADPEELAALRAAYTGCVYPYWDYEKIITFDQMRSSLFMRLLHEEKRSKALTAAVKSKHRELAALRNATGASHVHDQ